MALPEAFPGVRGCRKAVATALMLGLLASCSPAASSWTSAGATQSGQFDSGAAEAVARDHVLDVLTFNAALLPAVVAPTRQAERVAVMAPHLLGYDVLVLQELFVNGWRESLLTQLAAWYPYRSDVVGKAGAGGNPFRQDGGIIILSRWPISRQASLTFGGACSGTDCLADKGVAYAEVNKGRFRYHVFATHAQSEYGFGVVGVRHRQFEMWRAFMVDQKISPGDPVVLAGDFNVDAYTRELASVLRTLNAVRPVTRGPHRFTWDPENNGLATGPSQWLDYVLYAADHAIPEAAWNRVVPLRAGSLDLSDHYAVWGRMVMASP